LHDADDALLVNRVIEEAEIANLHRLHMFLGQRVPHTVPFAALRPKLHLIFTREGARFRLEQPVIHKAILSLEPISVRDFPEVQVVRPRLWRPSCRPEESPRGSPRPSPAPCRSAPETRLLRRSTSRLRRFPARR